MLQKSFVLFSIHYIKEIKHNYDFVLIDCTPSLEMITINAFAAGDSVIIPVQAHYLPLKGMTQLTMTIGKVRKQINPKLKINGGVLTLVAENTNLAKITEETRQEAKLKKIYDILLSEIVICVNYN